MAIPAVSDVTSSRTVSPDGADSYRMVELRDAHSSSEPANQTALAASGSTESATDGPSHHVAIASPSGQVHPVPGLISATTPVGANISGSSTSQQSSTTSEEPSKHNHRFWNGKNFGNMLAAATLIIAIYYGWRSLEFAKWTASMGYEMPSNW